MKCQNCGKHEATFHYRLNMNGEVMEQHLCSACAAGMKDSVFAQAGQQAMFAPMAGSLFGSMANEFFNDFPAWGAPWITAPGAAGIPAAPVESDPEIPVDAGEDIKKRRKINALRQEQETAVKTENFERAAEIRDEIYRLENNK